MSLKRFRPSGAMIVACVALVAALAGTAYAATTINDTSQIKGRVVTGKDLVKGSVGGEVVRENSLRGLGTRWFLLNEQGAIEEQSGGFAVLDGYVTNQNAYIDTGETLVGKGLTATIAIQNMVNVSGGPEPDPGFAGEVSVARCQVPGVVECAPANSKTENALVVSPRNSDGTATSAGNRKRVYVTVTDVEATNPGE